MVLVINGVDNEFAVATGNNVGTTANSSTFDNPPNGSKDLIITSNDGDTSASVFSLGDTYDVAWGGAGGGGGTPHCRGVRRPVLRPQGRGPATNSRPAVMTGAKPPGATTPPAQGSAGSAHAPNRRARSAAEALRR